MNKREADSFEIEWMMKALALQEAAAAAAASSMSWSCCG